MGKVPCPVPGYDMVNEQGKPVYYVTVPDEWLGMHSEAFWNAQQAISEQKATVPPRYQELIYSLALADYYRLPMLEGKPENWQSEIFRKFPLEVMAWVNYLLVNDYLRCFEVKKNWLRPSPNGSIPQKNGLPVGSLVPTA